MRELNRSNKFLGKTNCINCSQKMDEASYIFGKIKDNNVRILIDTGTNKNIMDVELAVKLKLKVNEIQNKNFCLYAANSVRMPVIGVTVFNVKFGDCTFPTEAYVVNKLTDKLLFGRQFLRKYRCILNYTDNSFLIDNVYKIPLDNDRARSMLASAVAEIKIPPRSWSVVELKIRPWAKCRDVLITNVPGKQFQKFGIARTLLHPVSETIPCRVLNFRENPIVIKQDEVVAQVLPVESTECVELYNDDDVIAFEKSLTVGNVAEQCQGVAIKEKTMT